MDKLFFVDMQGFLINEQFIVKEFAVLQGGCKLTHLIFKQAMDWNLLTQKERSRACWVTANHHGLQWTDGNIDYRDMKQCIKTAIFKDFKPRIMTSEITTNIDTQYIIYVKGIEKIKWLKNIIGEMITDYNMSIHSIDVNYVDIEKLEFLNKAKTMHCIYHTKYCAMENVMKLYNWLLERNNTLSTQL